MRRGEDGTSRRRQRVRQGGVETEQPMRMPGTQQHALAALGGSTDPIGEGIQSGQSPLRIDHIKAGYALRIGRNPTPRRHQLDQIPLPPGPFRIEPNQHTRITSSTKPITPEALLPRGGHDPGKPSGQKMRAKGSGTQHESDADGRKPTGSRERQNTAHLG